MNMILDKVIPNLAFFALLAAAPLAAQINYAEYSNKDCHHHYGAAFGKLSASPTIAPLAIASPQASLPSTTGWQPFPVDTFSTSLNTTSTVPTNATITVAHPGTYLVNATLTLKYPTPSSGGPADLTNYVIGVIVDGELETDSFGAFHISTEDTRENPGLLFSASLSDLFALDANSTVQFVIAGGTGSASPAVLDVASANATIVRVGR
jgi:hypothetical protein